jgi:two-component system nitrate/nitrite response regulator NarL
LHGLTGSSNLVSIIVLIADAQRLFSGALASALDRRFDIKTLDTRPTSWPETLEAVQMLAPDVLVADYWMEGMRPHDAIPAILERAPKCKIIVLSSLISHQQMNEVLAAGASGCLPRGIELKTLAEGIRRAYQGQVPVFAEELQKMLDTLDRRHERSVELGQRLESLTPREIEILVALTSGLPAKELADRLSVSPQTVKWHIKQIFTKTGAKSQAEVIAMARDSGFMRR